MSDRLERVIAGIDAANSADPTLEMDAGEMRPAALLYGLRMSEELARLCPDPSEELQIAARGQHVERWTSPRSSYPEGRAGYLAWRSDLGRFHADRVAGLMRDTGYGQDSCQRVGRMLRKEGIKRDPETQMLEDVICFVFMRWYLPGFSSTRAPEALERIVAKTARKMSAEARVKAAREFSIPEPLGVYFAA